MSYCPDCIPIDPQTPEQEPIRKAVGICLQGGVIAYPTETVYGIGGDPLRLDVIERIDQLKGRDPEKTFLLLVSSRIQWNAYVERIPAFAIPLIKKFWPGPLTLIFPASRMLPFRLTGEKGTIGLRESSDPICQALVAAFGKPLISTSANPSGKPPARSAQEVMAYFPQGLDLILDGGERRTFQPSTVLDVTHERPVLIRTGPIDKMALEQVIGPIDE